MGYNEEYEKISAVEEQFNEESNARESCQRYTVEDVLAKWGVDVKEQIGEGERK